VPLVTTLFQYGAFSAVDTFATRDAVIAYSVGLVGLILVKVLAPGFYAQQNIKTPVKVAIVSLVATQLMNLALVWHLRHAGLALAISIGAFVNAGLLFVLLRRAGAYRPQPGWAVFALKLGLAVYVMAVVLWLTGGSASEWLAARAYQRVVWLAGIVVAGAGSYFAALWVLGFRLSDFSHRTAE